MRDALPSAASRDLPLRGIVLLALAAFASSINLRVSDPLLPVIAHELSATVGQASATVAAFAVGYGLLQLVFGPVGDRWGKLRVVGLTAVMAGVATAAVALGSTLGSLIALRFMAGGFAAASIPLAFAWIGDVVPFEQRQTILARFLTAQISGIVLGQALGGYLGEVLGWRAVFVVVGAVHVLAGLALLVGLQLHPAVQPPPAKRRSIAGGALADMLRLLSRRWVRVMLASVAIEGFAFYGAFAYIGADLHHRLGVGLAAVGAMIATFALGAIAYTLTARRLLARLGERGLAAAGGILLCLGYAALALNATVTLVPLVMVVLGLGFYMIHNTLQTNATQMAPEARGLGVSLFAFALFMGQSLGVALAAPLVDRLGAPAVYLVAAVLLPAVALWFRSQLSRR